MSRAVSRPVTLVGRTSTLLVVPLLCLSLLAGCGGDEFDDYCAVVEEHQLELTEITTSGEPGALLEALPIYQDLRENAPDDITDEWQQVVRAVQGLVDALAEAGIDASAYDPQDPPEELSDEQEAAIKAAADQLASRATQEALEGVEQQARDVCQTPLTL